MVGDVVYAIKVYSRDRFSEGIPFALVGEVIRALPDAAEIRLQLEHWVLSKEQTELSVEQLIELEGQLAEFAHTTQTELGEVGRLPHGISGRIVEPSQFDGEPIYSAVVLAMAVRRLIVIKELGTRYFFTGSEQRDML